MQLRGEPGPSFQTADRKPYLCRKQLFVVRAQKYFFVMKIATI